MANRELQDVANVYAHRNAASAVLSCDRSEDASIGS